MEENIPETLIQILSNIVSLFDIEVENQHSLHKSIVLTFQERNHVFIIFKRININ